MQEYENEELERLVTLKAENKVQVRLIEKMNLENTDLKKLLQILEEKEYDFKEEISNLKNQLEMTRITKVETGNQLNNQVSHCEKLVAELEEIIFSLNK